nr:hypothetical protein GZ28G7_39 [uncultured archaeon GZfos28G7]
MRIRSLRSSFDETRMPLRKLLAILLKRHSIMLSHEACVGVNTKEKRFDTVNRYSLVSLEVCAEWLSSVITSFICERFINRSPYLLAVRAKIPRDGRDCITLIIIQESS